MIPMSRASLAGWLSLLAGVLALPPAEARDPAGLPPELLSTVESLIARQMAAEEVPGATVAVALDGRLVWSAGYGMADLENLVPATALTRIRTASISKWMTAVAAMRLVEEGKLDVEAEPQRYCKAYPRKQWPMKVRHLLNHTAGVRHYHGANDESRDTEAQRLALEERQRREEAGEVIRYTETTGPIAAFGDDPLLSRPGTRYHYTSHGYRLLGCVLEGAAGESYRSLTARTVFGPAGMRDTIEDDAWAIVPYRAAGYSADPEGRLRRADFRDVSENLPAGGHLSTAQDLVSFALAFDDGRLVGAHAVARMLERPEGLQGERNSDSYYGFGVTVRDSPQGRLLGHTGGQDGTSTCLELVPDSGFAVAVMANKNTGGPTRQGAPALCKAIREAILGPAP